MTRTPSARMPALPSRRQFLQNSTAALLGGALASTGTSWKLAHAAGDDVLKVGLIGCGGRGSGAAAQALQADPRAKLTALGDVFPDRLQSCLSNLLPKFGDQMDVPADRQFVGFEAYQQVIDSGVDVVLLATPPHFRPAHLKAAVAAKKHCFVEKPVAVDAPGVRRVMESVAEAKKQNLSVVSGLCYRYDPGKIETIGRIHDGAIGNIVAMNVNYNTQSLWHFPRKPEWTDMEWQMRNWMYFTWLSGDHNVEQHVHSLDKAAWAMRDETPLKAIGLGGRQVRVQPEFGHIFDHHAVVYDYAGGQKLFAYCRQQAGCTVDVSDYIMGTKGTADLMKHVISGEQAWKFASRDKKKTNMYQLEHDALFASIRSGQPINNGDYMVRSTMLAILGRMATYTGQSITWDQAMNSQEDLTPPSYDWNAALPVPPVALPGITKFA